MLYAAVTEFIATAEPVGSRTLAKKYGLLLSPATIRNVLSDLEEAGFLEQPHTSAGRVPTETAFRLFIDTLMQLRQLPSEKAQLQDLFSELPADADLLRETGRILSDLSGAPSVLVRNRGENRTLMKLRFIATRPAELLVVIVFSDGSVENRFVPVESALSDVELERVHQLLEDSSGLTLHALRDRIQADLSTTQDELVKLRSLSLALVDAAIERATQSVEVLVHGQSRLLDRPEFGTTERVRELLNAFEDRERLLSLLNLTLAAAEVRVFLGEETAKMVGCAVSLVAAPFREENGTPAGALGIIGPTRMDYPYVVPLVGAAADAMSAAFLRKSEGKTKGL